MQRNNRNAERKKSDNILYTDSEQEAFEIVIKDIEKNNHGNKRKKKRFLKKKKVKSMIV